QRAQVERERAQAAREHELMQAQIEAQRALIENQKVQMQMVVQLFERVTGSGDPVAMLQQQLQFQRQLEAETKRRNAGSTREDAGPNWVKTLEQYTPAIASVLQMLGLQIPTVQVVEEDEENEKSAKEETKDKGEEAPKRKASPLDGIEAKFANRVLAIQS